MIEDIELIARELIENSVAPKQNRMAAHEHKAVTELLVSKDKELKETLKLAAEQDEVEKEIEMVRAEVSVQDQHIKALQGQLKEAETLLASTIYQAKQKLANISRSSPVLSEDLIKYSHRISASNAVCAPLNWQQVDPRRPYPTDMEMRSRTASVPAAAACDCPKLWRTWWKFEGSGRENLAYHLLWQIQV